MRRKPRSPVITLTTDFGLNDWFVGAMKGVILDRCRQAVIVDITHMVPPGDIQTGAFALLAVHRFFPENTVHVAVIDPGVGSDRPAIAARGSHAFFVGPDNGLLSWALATSNEITVRRIENHKLFLEPVSATFHGRDVFAPVAAYIASGGNFENIGPEVTDWIRLPWKEPVRTTQGLSGRVVHIDRFGNAITNIPNSVLIQDRLEGYVTIGKRRRVPVRPCYAAVAAGKPVAVPGSTGYIEIAVNGGNAAAALAIRRGSLVTFHP